MNYDFNLPWKQMNLLLEAINYIAPTLSDMLASTSSLHKISWFA